MNAHAVKPVRLIQSLCAVCGSNLAGLTILYIVLPCVAAVVSRPAWQMLVLLIAQYVSNLINKHYYYYYYCPNNHRKNVLHALLSLEKRRDRVGWTGRWTDARPLHYAYWHKNLTILASAEMYASCIASSHGDYANWTDRFSDASKLKLCYLVDHNFPLWMRPA